MILPQELITKILVSVSLADLLDLERYETELLLREQRRNSKYESSVHKVRVIHTDALKIRKDPAYVLDELVSNVDEFLNVMLASSSVLSGSRAASYFNPSVARESSDWDIYCNGNQAQRALLITYLTSQGFHGVIRGLDTQYPHSVGTPVTGMWTGCIMRAGTKHRVQVMLHSASTHVENILSFGATVTQSYISGYGAVCLYPDLLRRNQMHQWRSVVRRPFRQGGTVSRLHSPDDVWANKHVLRGISVIGPRAAARIETGSSVTDVLGDGVLTVLFRTDHGSVDPDVGGARRMALIYEQRCKWATWIERPEAAHMPYYEYHAQRMHHKLAWSEARLMLRSIMVAGIVDPSMERNTLLLPDVFPDCTTRCTRKSHNTSPCKLTWLEIVDHAEYTPIRVSAVDSRVPADYECGNWMISICNGISESPHSYNSTRAVDGPGDSDLKHFARGVSGKWRWDHTPRHE
jgi:hypothetical protein